MFGIFGPGWITCINVYWFTSWWPIGNFLETTWGSLQDSFWGIVWRIFGYSNIFEYFPIRIFVRIIFVSFFWYEYIRIFVRMLFLDTNLFVYSFVSFFWYEYIRIFVRMVFNIRIYLCQLKLLCGINHNKFTPHSLAQVFVQNFSFWWLSKHP